MLKNKDERINTTQANSFISDKEVGSQLRKRKKTQHGDYNPSRLPTGRPEEY